MSETELQDPLYADVPGRVVCVIPLYIPVGRKKDYGHFVEDKFESLEKTLAAHGHFNPGIEYSIVLINNGSPVWKDVEHFRKLGYTVLSRPNEGYGFGAWKHAWEMLGNHFDHFLFTEDDNAPAKDGWLKEILDLFKSDARCGAVGNFIEAHGRDAVADEVQMLRGTDRPMLYCFDGAFTFTSAEVLRQVDQIGGLPVYPCQPKHERSATVNELAFQQPILELGYKLLSFADRDRLLIHGSELYTGDLANRGPIAPIVNHNAGRIVPEVAAAFSWYA